jgi:addiction module HigA family antidote
MTASHLDPIHPGEILHEEFMKPLGLSRNRLGIDLGVPPQRVGEIIRGRRAVTVDTALRLARYFRTSPQFWLSMQTRFDLDTAEAENLPERIEREVRPGPGSREAAED